MRSSLLLGGLLSSVVIVTAFAQSNPPAPAATPAPPAATTTTTTTTASTSSMWRASKVIGVNVYNDQDEKLGSISEILLDKSGKIDGVIVGVGGFLGMGEHLVAVPYDKLKFVNEAVAYTGTGGTMSKSTTTTGAATGTDKTTTTTTTKSSSSKWYPDHAVFNATKDELKNMPEFKYSE